MVYGHMVELTLNKVFSLFIAPEILHLQH